MIGCENVCKRESGRETCHGVAIQHKKTKPMKRSLFFIITAIISIVTGSILLFYPNFIVEGNHWISSPQIESLFRLLGSMVVSIGILNLIVRNHADSDTLRAVLILNITKHTIDLILDLISAKQGISSFKDLIPFFIGHIFIGSFSLYYLLKMKSTNN